MSSNLVVLLNVSRDKVKMHYIINIVYDKVYAAMF